MTGRRASEYVMAMLIGMLIKADSNMAAIVTLLAMAMDAWWVLITHPELQD
ncbi:hypothetical protein GTO87_02755 [Ligilactobacillus saerimneri]|uniref:Uncharacterized protein n=1 Tax=Ligilactobacillus saerimneri TaxID=228229 RepID=A0A7H9EJ08_9LACO|nr:hypothetical protein [Ligilactobacillus saerimneri]QLL77611.1 hypothetical protein GTO87_02755 [Ligilactobacillus saerimneri]